MKSFGKYINFILATTICLIIAVYLVAIFLIMGAAIWFTLMIFI